MIHDALLHAWIGYTQPPQLIFKDLTIISLLRGSLLTFWLPIFLIVFVKFCDKKKLLKINLLNFSVLILPFMSNSLAGYLDLNLPGL